MGLPETIHDPEVTDLSPNGHSESPDEPGSVREHLREKREALKKRTTLDLLVPGYDGELAIRYHAIPGQVAEKLGRKIQDSGTRALDASADFLIRCCEVVLVRNDGKLEELETDDGEPVQFDHELAQVFGFEAEKAREIVLGVFSPEQNRDLAVIEHGTALINWMQGHEAEIDRSLLDF